MKEPVAWAVIWLVVGFTVGYLTSWVREALRAHDNMVSLAGMIRSMVKAGETKLLLDFADRIEGKMKKP